MNMENNLVYKSNQIIEASYSLSVREQQLLLACISQLKSDEELDTKQGYVLTIEQSQELFYTDKDRKNAYRDLKEASRKLFDRCIKLKSKDGRYTLLTRWVSSVKFDDEEMTSTLYFHDQIKPYISQLQSNFTKYKLQWVRELTSKYAVRVYEMIVSWHCNNQSFKELEIDEFRELLDIYGKYRQHSELTRYVIKPIIHQINTYTDFQIEITFRKKGRSFKWIQLRFNKKQQTQSVEDKEPMNVQALTYWTSSRQALKHLCDKYGIDIDLLLNSLKKREHPENKGQQHYDNLTDKYLSKVIAKACKYVQTEDYIKTEIKELRSMIS